MSSKKQTNSEKKYRKLFEHSMDAAYITTPEGEVIDINPAGLEMFGYSRDEFLKLDVSDLYVDPPVREKALKALEDQGYLRNFEYELYRKDKSTVTVQENCTSVKDEGGRVSMYYGVLRNITHQKKLEKKLSTIYGLSKEMTLSRDTDEISKFVLNAAKKVLNFDICALLLLDDETNEIYVKNYYGYDKKIKDFRVSLDDPVGITAYVAVTKETYYAPNVVKDEIYLNYCSKTMSELCAPIKVGGKVLGVIDVESERKNAFLESDQQLVEALASQAAIAIENAELFKKLSSLKEFHERIVNSLNEGIWIEDRDGNCTYANPKMKKMLGYEKIVGKHWKEIVPPERREEMQKETKFRSEGRASTYESLFLTKNGEEIPVLISATPLFEDGEYSGVIAVWIDIRKKKEMEKKLSTIYDLSREMSLSLDMDHISELVLSAAKDILKFDNIDLFILNKETKELQLQRCSGLKDPDRHTTVPLFGEKGITAYVARTMESQNIPDVRKNDRYIPGLEESQSELSVPLIVRDKVIGVIDVESRKKNAFSEEDEQLLKTLASPTAIAIENARLLEKIRKYSEFQKLFISILTHDLKNPITVIKGYAEMIGNNVDERTKRCVKGIERGTKKMSTLINNVVFYSKLQEKEYKKKFEKKDLTHVIQEALEDLKEKTKEKDIEVVYGVEGRYPLNANSTLGNVFLNLLDNAIKYSPRGSRVEIGIDDRGESWSVSVKDQGEGVPDELKEVIFRRFTQKKVDVRGTGLGLTIVKQIVDLHGGRVWVEDNPEGGSVFLVELPKTTESTHNQHPKEPPT